MPIYEFSCPECGIVFSEIRRFSESGNPADCPACSKPTSLRTPPSFMVRGAPESRSPRSLAEQLAGRGAQKPAGDGTTGILGHKCHPGCGC